MNYIRRVHSPIIPKLVGLFRDDVPRARSAAEGSASRYHQSSRIKTTNN